MSLPKQVTNEIRREFNSGPDQYTLILPFDEANAFWFWFEMNAEKFEVSQRYDSGVIGKSAIAGRCFGNSQTVALQSSEEYCEGFMKWCNDFVFHGFNLCEGRVNDYTALSNIEHFTDPTTNQLPSEYYGVRIPTEFIRAENYSDIMNGIVNIPHLIYKYYKSLH